MRLFTLTLDNVLGAFDDTELQTFVKDKEVLSIRDHFFVKDETPYLVVLVTYHSPHPESKEPSARTQAGENKEKWKEILEEADWPLFNTLRDWRNGLAREEGIPAYVICTNRQLAEIAHRRPPSLHKLASIEGMGKAKLERYGEKILKIVGPETIEAEQGKEATCSSLATTRPGSTAAVTR